MKTLIVAIALLGAAPAFAQNALTTPQSPPAGNSNESTPNTTNSLPLAAGTERPTNQAGSTVGGAAVVQPSTTVPTSSTGVTTTPPPVK